MKITNQTFDIIALTSSVLCAVHCTIVPLLVTFSAVGSLSFLSDPLIELGFIGLGLLLAAISLFPSFKNIHKDSCPLFLAFTGFFLIAISRFDFSILWEVLNTVMGACLLSYSHYKNWHLLRKHKHQQ